MTTTTNRTKVSRSNLEQENLLSVQSEKIEMKLNTSNAIAQGLLIQRLTELYENPIEATVRETISNGLDAVAVEFSGPVGKIEVESPTELNPIFVVRDNGVGMTYEDLKNIYSVYGASTKLDNFDQIGAYGLGAKAPLAYGTQFTVSSVRAGIKTTIVVVREELTNYIRVIETGETTEPSGTTVSVPVSNTDIHSFREQVQKYTESPVDYNAELYIDGKLVDGKDYVLLDEEVTVFSKDGEEVKARLWFKSDENKIVRLLTNLNESDLKRNLKLVIGGWSYSSPHGRNSFYGSNDSSLFVELKPGIVAFNSARDAVLLNARYNEFEELIVKYVKSPKFLNQMVSVINSMEIEKFKRVVISLVSSVQSSIYINENNEIEVKAQSNSYNFIHNFKISDFVHEETGFNFKNITAGIPKVEKPTAGIYVQKYGYKVTYDYSALLTIEKTRLDRTRNLRAADSSEYVKQALENNETSTSLASLMITSALSAYTEKNSKSVLTIVTDMVPSEDKKDPYLKVISARKSIVDMYSDSGAFSQYLVYTKHTKKDIEKMIEASELELNVNVLTAQEMADKVAEHRKANRSTPTIRDVNKDFSARIETLDGPVTKKIAISEVDKTKKNIFISSKERFLSSSELTGLLNGYCNTHKLKTEDVNIYSLVGNLRVIEMEILEEMGEIFEYKKSPGAGTSKTYKEKVSGKFITPATFSIFDDKLEKKAFVRLVCSISSDNLSTSLSNIEKSIKKINNIAEVLKMESSVFKMENFQDLLDFATEEYGTSTSYHFWTLTDSEIQELMTHLSDEKKQIIEFLYSVAHRYRNNSLPVHNEEEVIVIYNSDEFIPQLELVKTAQKTEKAFPSKLILNTAKNVVEMSEDQIKTLNELTF